MKRYIKMEVLANNYKKKHKLPTKKEEKDFVDNLSREEKQYWVLPMKERKKFEDEDKVDFYNEFYIESFLERLKVSLKVMGYIFGKSECPYGRHSWIESFTEPTHCFNCNKRRE